ncbi:MAG TPA: hypothetical protein VGC41_05280 [Kofleriaceae bacterium]
MFESLRKRLTDLRWEASDRAWSQNWKAIRAVATPWMKREYEAAREKLRAARKPRELDREIIDRALADAAPPGVPFEAVVLPAAELRARFPDGPELRRGTHLVGKLRMTHRAETSESILVMVLFSDVAADYFVESMAADVAAMINDKYGEDVAIADAEAGIPIVLKEFAVAAGLGVIGKNALFYSRTYGFNCKLSVVFLNGHVSSYDPAPTTTEWRLSDCATCNLCVEACPVSAFDDYTMNKASSCDRFIAGDYFGPRRDHMCRACITRCPVSNDVLKLRRKEGAPRRMFWDNEAQVSLMADLFMYRPAFWLWVMQRFYYGADLPGRPSPNKKKDPVEALTNSVRTATSDRTRDGWRLYARKRR